MAQAASTKCYIEEYTTENHKPGARLREKGTGRKVDLGFASAEDAAHFRLFLGAASTQRDSMPEVYSKDGDEDCVVVSGDVDFSSPEEIRFIHNEDLQYLFA